jgi:translocation and assembly module TamA
VASLQKADAKSGQEVTQNVADETQFAGTQPTDQQSEKSQVEQQKMQQRASENDQLQAQAREEKKVPVIVTLNADRLNSVETGIGYGTDTEFRIRTQYRRAIVNSLGHSFDANLELSKIRQAIDGRYSIPYKDPINDYINLVGGYEREDRDDIGPDVSLETESAVFGAERIIKNPLGGWQHSFGFRYRLDRLTQHGVVDSDDIPDAFKVRVQMQNKKLYCSDMNFQKQRAIAALTQRAGLNKVIKLSWGVSHYYPMPIWLF